MRARSGNPLPSSRIPHPSFGFTARAAATLTSRSRSLAKRRSATSAAGVFASTSACTAAIRSAVGFRLPDLSRLPEGGLISGELDVGVSLASVEGFDYATLTSEQLSRFSWQAYATDVARARYVPTAP